MLAGNRNSAGPQHFACGRIRDPPRGPGSSTTSTRTRTPRPRGPKRREVRSGRIRQAPCRPPVLDSRRRVTTHLAVSRGDQPVDLRRGVRGVHHDRRARRLACARRVPAFATPVGCRVPGGARPATRLRGTVVEGRRLCPNPSSAPTLASPGSDSSPTITGTTRPLCPRSGCSRRSRRSTHRSRHLGDDAS